jgi:aminobutyraldehyde dehydrogenase
MKRSTQVARPPALHAVNEMPHGGLKSSDYGKDLSLYALEDYTVPRHVMVKM